MKWRTIAAVVGELAIVAGLAFMTQRESGPWTCLLVLFGYLELVTIRATQWTLTKRIDGHLCNCHLRRIAGAIQTNAWVVSGSAVKGAKYGN